MPSMVVKRAETCSFSTRYRWFFLLIRLRKNCVSKTFAGMMIKKNSVTIQLLYAEMPTDTSATMMFGMSTLIRFVFSASTLSMSFKNLLCSLPVSISLWYVMERCCNLRMTVPRMPAPVRRSILSVMRE